MEELKHKVDLRAAERIIIFEIASHLQSQSHHTFELAFYFKMLSVVLSGLVLIRNIFEET